MVGPVIFQLRTVGRAKVSDSIVDQLLEGVRSGAFAPGDVLPPERVLAERFGVSRGSVREAIRALEYAGVLSVRMGSGTYVTEAGVSKTLALRAHAALVGEHSPLDVVMARRALEPVCAQLAAANRQPADLAELRGLLDEQERHMRAGVETTEVDLAFHVGVAGACHNPVLLILFDHIAEVMRQQTWLDLRFRARHTPGTPTRYMRQHRATFAAIERGDAASAARSVRAHLVSVEKRLLKVVGD